MLSIYSKLISTTDWLRIALIYCHLLIFAFSLVAVLKTDIKIILGKFCRKEIARTANGIAVLLTALWASGLLIIYLDTGFSLAILAANSKLLIKLLCVLTLTANGYVLHKVSFPVLTRDDGALTKKDSILLAVTGSLSTSHWMLAAFIGLSQPLSRLPFQTLMAAYLVFITAVIVTSLLFIPLLLRAAASQTGTQSSGSLLPVQ